MENNVNVTLSNVYQGGRTTEDYIGFLYALLMFRPKVMNISHKKLPTFTDHEKFVRSEPYKDWFIILDEHQSPIGATYLTHSREIGIQLAHDKRGKGYGTAALRRMMERAGPGDLFANINPANRTSQQFFGKAGFKLIQHTYRLERAEGAQL